MDDDFLLSALFGPNWLKIDVVPTGVPLEPEFPFLATVTAYDGALVHHVYGEIQQ